MIFSKDESYLLLYYQLVDDQHQRLNDDPNGLFVLWDLNNNNSVKNLEIIKQTEWENFNFPNTLDAAKLFRTNTHLSQVQEIQEDNLHMTAMCNTSSILCLGNLEGQIHFTKLHTLYQENSGKQEHLAKSYAAHCSFVNQIEMVDQCLFYLVTSLPRAFRMSVIWNGD